MRQGEALRRIRIWIDFHIAPELNLFQPLWIKIMNANLTVISSQQFEQIRSYLDKDCQMHLAAHGNWILDSGKMETAFESAGVVVEWPQENIG
jgi:hypothetical protein